MAIAFLPFPTAVLGEYLKDGEHRQAAVSLYCIGLFAPAFMWFWVWAYGMLRGLLDEALHPRYLRFATAQYAFSFSVYSGAFAVSFLSPWAALALSAGITGVYLFPPRRAEYLELPDTVELPD
jgi:Na+-driven multidrug efflux pump